MKAKQLLLTTLIVGATFAGITYKDIVQSVKAEITTNKTVETREETSILSPKEDLQNKMYNSIDNFEKAKGKFIYSSNAIGDVLEVEYNIKTKNGIFSHAIVKSNDTFFETSYDQEKEERMRVDHKGKTAIKSHASDIPVESKKIKPKDKTYKNEKGEGVFARRADPTYMGGLATTSLFPQDIAASFLEDYNNWDIISTNESISGQEAVLIEGKLNEYFQIKHKATKFKLWVQKDTGILLAMEEYDDTGKITESLKTVDIKLNSKVDSKKETISIPNTYSKMGNF